MSGKSIRYCWTNTKDIVRVNKSERATPLTLFNRNRCRRIRAYVGGKCAWHLMLQRAIFDVEQALFIQCSDWFCSKIWCTGVCCVPYTNKVWSNSVNPGQICQENVECIPFPGMIALDCKMTASFLSNFLQRTAVGKRCEFRWKLNKYKL